MLERVTSDWRRAAVTEIRLIGIAVAASAAAATAIALACAGAFVAVMNRHGVVDACLAVAAVFLALTLLLLALYWVLRRRAARAAAMARARSRSLIADPLVVATGVQVLQAIGLKRALTLLAIVGGALGALTLASAPAARTGREARGIE
jgi:uncharacterized membrane protein YsdA (DUF1294 family)